MTKIDENAEMREILASLNKDADATITSWGDLYGRLKEAAKQFTDDPRPGSASGAVAILLAFVLALEELPEEGDAVAIAKRMNEIFLLHPERTGVRFLVVSSMLENTQQAVDALAASIREERLASHVADEEVQEAMNETPTHKYLH